MTASRKLAAILAADVLGYSRLMGKDEAGAAQEVRERREAAAPVLAAHGGWLFKTVGDGMLIEFPRSSPRLFTAKAGRSLGPSDIFDNRTTGPHG
jgi:class 3 adenylate cyclase